MLFNFQFIVFTAYISITYQKAFQISHVEPANKIIQPGNQIKQNYFILLHFYIEPDIIKFAQSIQNNLSNSESKTYLKAYLHSVVKSV